MEPLLPDDPRRISGYTLTHRIGAGGMGQVYLGYSRDGAQVAVKVIKPELSSNQDFRVRFKREAAAMMRVSGDYTVPVTGADPDGEPPWLATKYVPAPTLAELVVKSGALPAVQVLTLATNLARALNAIHSASITHRDLKPGNILIPTSDTALVIDFGLAVTATNRGGPTASGVLIGTPSFMSPEQIDGTSSVGPASDVFSLGSVLHYASTGRAPYGDGGTMELMYRVVNQPPDLAAVPAGTLRDLVAWCKEKRPGDRPVPEDILQMVRTGVRSKYPIPPSPPPTSTSPSPSTQQLPPPPQPPTHPTKVLGYRVPNSRDAIGRVFTAVWSGMTATGRGTRRASAAAWKLLKRLRRGKPKASGVSRIRKPVPWRKYRKRIIVTLLLGVLVYLGFATYMTYRFDLTYDAKPANLFGRTDAAGFLNVTSDVVTESAPNATDTQGTYTWNSVYNPGTTVVYSYRVMPTPIAAAHLMQQAGSAQPLTYGSYAVVNNNGSACDLQMQSGDLYLHLTFSSGAPNACSSAEDDIDTRIHQARTNPPFKMPPLSYYLSIL